MRGRRESLSYKLINLTNKSLFLRVSKTFIVYKGYFSFKGGFALMPLY
jgi:hypothetical protein